MASLPPVHAALLLASLATRRSARIVALPAEHAAALAAEGVAAGGLVEIETRQPFGGPVVVRGGHARIAIAARVAREVVVEPMGPGSSAR